MKRTNYPIEQINKKNKKRAVAFENFQFPGVSGNGIITGNSSIFMLVFCDERQQLNGRTAVPPALRGKLCLPLCWDYR